MNPIPALQRAWIGFASTFREDDEDDEAMFDDGLLTLPVHMQQRLGVRLQYTPVSLSLRLKISFHTKESTMPTFQLTEATPKDTHPPVSFSCKEVLDTE
jgi:hypothetical protein